MVGDRTNRFGSLLASHVVTLILLAAVREAGAAPAYTAIDLTPAGDVRNASVNAAATGQQVGNFASGALGFNEQPVLWTGTAASAVDLLPAGKTFGVANATDGIRQGGIVGGRAAYWSGTAASYVDVHPATGYVNSSINAVNGNQLAGHASVSAAPNNLNHAMVWTIGPSVTSADLHPIALVPGSPGLFTESVATGTNGTRQIGYGNIGIGVTRALLWSGAAATAVDITPVNFSMAAGQGIWGNQKVGFGNPIGGVADHAILWNGPANTVVDLHPLTGYVGSAAWGTNGIQQVGDATTDGVTGQTHAMVWDGAANSFLDLHSTLPVDYAFSSATSIDADGNIGGYAFNSDFTRQHAILWRPVPEPAGALGLTGLGWPMLGRRRRPR